MKAESDDHPHVQLAAALALGKIGGMAPSSILSERLRAQPTFAQVEPRLGTLLAFGALMFQTGLAESVGKALLHAAGAQSSWSITLIAIALAVTITSFASNTASANMVIPVVISLAKAANIDPVPPAMGACLGASFGFLLPVSTPPNALAYASGLVPITRLIKLGFLLSIAGIFVLFAGMYLLPLKH